MIKLGQPNVETEIQIQGARESSLVSLIPSTFLFATLCWSSNIPGGNNLVCGGEVGFVVCKVIFMANPTKVKVMVVLRLN